MPHLQQVEWGMVDAVMVVDQQVLQDKAHL
jgi:hypothetical protein